MRDATDIFDNGNYYIREIQRICQIGKFQTSTQKAFFFFGNNDIKSTNSKLQITLNNQNESTEKENVIRNCKKKIFLDESITNAHTYRESTKI